MDQNDPVSRRHAASGSVQREAATSPGFNLEAVGHPGVSGEPKEECIVPNQEIGTPRNSSKMLISFPRPKMHSITQLASSLVAKERVTLRDQARIMGTMVAAYLSVLPAPLHYHFPNHLPYQAKVEMTRDMVDQRSQQAQRERFLVVESHASEMGWGACLQELAATAQHQLSRTASSFSRPPDVHVIEEGHCDPTSP